jgi:NAD(P)-dependent dehydrogenase (short-subunit alcohol dehydrogenase family)
MRLGIIGAGPIGRTVGRLLAEAGHDVLASWASSDARLYDAAEQIGHGARTGRPRMHNEPFVTLAPGSNPAGRPDARLAEQREHGLPACSRPGPRVSRRS